MRIEPPGHGNCGPVSVIVPAHNEELIIGRLLGPLLDEPRPDELEVIVVCNGCSDQTADAARRFGNAVHVIDLPTPSKAAALERGNIEARYFPRLYVDADIELTKSALLALCKPLRDNSVLAAAPERTIRLDEANRLVKSYYAVWQRLPQVRAGLFGRGVVAVSESGFKRIESLPHVLSDDLAISEAFGLDERRIVPGATVTIHPPRTLRDLLRRRIRVVSGNVQLDQMGGRSVAARTSWSDLVQIVRKEPAMSLRIAVFIGVAGAAKLGARRRVRSGDFNTWSRDESSRLG